MRLLIEGKLETSAMKQSEEAKALREELNGSFHRLGANVATTLTDIGQQQKERLEATTQALQASSEASGKSIVARGFFASQPRASGFAATCALR